MKTPLSPKITFYRVKDNKAKIHWICTKALESIKDEKRLIITVPNFQAAQYIDTLLWRSPPDSFIPHLIADTTTAEWIAITMQGESNVNQASRLLNLCSAAPAFYQQVEQVYEFFDESDAEKGELSRKRIQFYESKGISTQIL